MKIWISKNSEVPVHEQLIAQITLAIAAGDYEIGQKLPSTREIARRCGLHANTVSSAYQKLARQNLLEFRKGSGFYVAESASEHIEGSRRLDELVEKFFESTKSLGFTEDEIIVRLKKARRPASANHVIVIESDKGLREILIHELTREFPQTRGVSWEEFSSLRLPGNALLAAMFDEKPKVDAALRDGQKCFYLKGRSVSSAMSGEARPAADEVVAVVSGWDGFLTFARIMLLAAEVDPGRLIIRSTSDPDWRKAISSASIIICDSLTAESLQGFGHVRPFPLIADESVSELAAVLSRNSLS